MDNPTNPNLNQPQENQSSSEQNPKNKFISFLINFLISLEVIGFVILFFYWGPTSYYYQIPGWLGVSSLFSAIGASVSGLVICFIDKYVKKRSHGVAITVFLVGIILWLIVCFFTMLGAIH